MMGFSIPCSFLLQLLTWPEIGCHSCLWWENVLYLCTAMVSSAWMATVVIMWDWFCWKMTSAHGLAAWKKGGHWTLLIHAHFPFTPIFYPLVIPSNFCNSAILSKPHSRTVLRMQFLFSSLWLSQSSTTSLIHRHIYVSVLTLSILRLSIQISFSLLPNLLNKSFSL